MFNVVLIIHIKLLMRRDYIDKNKLRCYRLRVRDIIKKQLLRNLTRNKLFFT